MGLSPCLPDQRDIDLRTFDRHLDAAVTSLIPSLSCRSCRPIRGGRRRVPDRLEHRAAKMEAEVTGMNTNNAMPTS